MQNFVAFSRNGAYQAREAQISDGIGFDILADLFDCVTGGNEFFLCRRVDPVEAGRHRWRATDSHVDFFGARGTNHFHNLAAGCSAHDGVIDENDPLSGEEFPDRIQLHLHTEIADLCLRLDKGSPDIVITNQAECGMPTPE